MKKSYLDKISNCVIDTSGVFKYVQIKLTYMNESKIVVRGWNGLEYHKNNYENFLYLEGEKLDGVDTDVIGGGRIKIKDKTAYVYGYSMGYGICDHSITCKLIEEAYPDYKTSWSNEGY